MAVRVRFPLRVRKKAAPTRLLGAAFFRSPRANLLQIVELIVNLGRLKILEVLRLLVLDKVHDL